MMTRGCRFGGEVPRRTALEAADDSGRPVALGWYCGGVVVLGAAWLVYDAFFVRFVCIYLKTWRTLLL